MITTARYSSLFAAKSSGLHSERASGHQLPLANHLIPGVGTEHNTCGQGSVKVCLLFVLLWHLWSIALTGTVSACVLHLSCCPSHPKHVRTKVSRAAHCSTGVKSNEHTVELNDATISSLHTKSVFLTKRPLVTTSSLPVLWALFWGFLPSTPKCGFPLAIMLFKCEVRYQFIDLYQGRKLPG